MKHIVIGTKSDGKGEVLYAGDDGDGAEKAMNSTGFRLLERFRLHAPMKRIVADTPPPAKPPEKDTPPPAKPPAKK